MEGPRRRESPNISVQRPVLGTQGAGIDKLLALMGGNVEKRKGEISKEENPSPATHTHSLCYLEHTMSLF